LTLGVIRYYRAPELILDRNMYTTKVDIWAFGCLFGELAKGSPLFVGDDSTTQAKAHMGFRNDAQQPTPTGCC
jgi:serine/threonine protein kinase